MEWIGEIPVDWEVERCKQLFVEVNDRCENGQEHSLLSVSEYYGVALRTTRMNDEDMLTHAETLDGYKLCYVNDFVMNIMLAWKSALGISRYHGIVSPAYCVYRNKTELDMRYYHYLFRTDLYANVFKQYSTGIIDSRLRLYPDKFWGLKCQVPPVKEQQHMADYLDKKCVKIDTIVAKQKEIIEKLRAYKHAVITETVTKGLNSDVEMKDSGIEFIGAIPNHWKIVKLKFLLTYLIDCPHETPTYPFINVFVRFSTHCVENLRECFHGFITVHYCRWQIPLPAVGMRKRHMSRYGVCAHYSAISIDTLEMTVEEAEAVEAVAQQVVMQKEQPDTFEGQNFSAVIKSYPYSVKLNSEALLNGLKITGDAIKTTGFFSVSNSALSRANTLSSAFGNLTDISGCITGAQGITPTLSTLAKSSGLAINSGGLLKGIGRMSEMQAPLSSQVNISSGLSEALNVQKIAAALDKPIVIDSPISKVMINGNINLAAKQKEDFLDGTEVKIGRLYEDDKDKE